MCIKFLVKYKGIDRLEYIDLDYKNKKFGIGIYLAVTFDFKE